MDALGDTSIVAPNQLPTQDQQVDVSSTEERHFVLAARAFFRDFQGRTEVSSAYKFLQARPEFHTPQVLYPDVEVDERLAHAREIQLLLEKRANFAVPRPLTNGELAAVMITPLPYLREQMRVAQDEARQTPPSYTTIGNIEFALRDLEGGDRCADFIRQPKLWRLRSWLRSSWLEQSWLE
ncbi:hypothetical protein CDD80_5972 [Ophiocordyceps camponoti-rufipedis]|uniref:Uncharacterized protein n=1 Tax=Ophiocordyceps camponoti-rufipedis TaxID=2004952 RepID=A0A2C5ZGM4_9HYPO|nr:hypothetical protein CDD80_5972 [Ophiocordyceps camponoti-rufipedis]